MSKGRKPPKRRCDPSTLRSSHSLQMAREPLGRRITRLLDVILHNTAHWCWTKKQPFFVSLSIAMTLLAGAFFFLPRVTVEPSGPYNPSHPSATIFTISNVNIVPLRNVQVAIGVCYVRMEWSENAEECNGSSLTKLLFKPWGIHWLDVDEKYQIAIEDAIRLPGNDPRQIEKADITIAVIYTPWRMPGFWRDTKEFRFITKRRSDGDIYWTPIPLNR